MGSASAGIGGQVTQEYTTTNWIDTTFWNLSIFGSNKLGPEDQLFVFVDDHGDTINHESYIVVPTRFGVTTRYFPWQLDTAIRNINCAQMIFVMQQCFSGGFIRPILNDIPNSLCMNRLILTSVDSSQFAWDEQYITHSTFGEFTYYLSAALRGYYPGYYPWMWGCKVGTFPFDEYTWSNQWNPYQSHPADYNPDNGDPSAYDSQGNTVSPGNSDGYTQFIEAFNYSNCMNTWSKDGYYDPGALLLNGTHPQNNPQFAIRNGFGVDTLYCLNGIAGSTPISSQSQEVLGYVSPTYSYSYLLGGRLSVRTPMTIDQSAQLTLGATSSILVAPNLQFTVNSNVKFFGDDGEEVNGLAVEDNSYQLNLENATFNNCYLVSVHTVPHFVDNCQIFDAQRDLSQQKAIIPGFQPSTLLITDPTRLIYAGF